MNTEIVKHKLCPVTGKEFPIYQLELDILDKTSPVINGKKYTIPEPKYSPKIRELIKMTFRNERHLYSRKCSATGDNIISVYPKEFEGEVFHFNYFQSDKWDRSKYFLQDIDFEKPMNSFKELLDNMPKKSLHVNGTMENCDYCNYGLNAKSCYMCQLPFESENCMYSYTSYKSKYDIDGYINGRSEILYESCFSGGCYKLFYSKYCNDCNNGWFLFNCKNCSDCFGCTNLNGKKYHFFNKELSKEKYFEKLNNIIGSNREVEKYSKKFNSIVDYSDLGDNNLLCEDINGGKSNGSSKDLINCNDCFLLESGINCRLSGENANNLSSAYANGLNLAYCYENIGIALGQKNAFIALGTNINDCYYNIDIRNSKNSFLSTGLFDNENTILNKQFGEEEYNTMLERVIQSMQKNGEWGNFFSTKLSLYPYNDTIANDYYPVNKVIYLDANKNIEKEEVFDEQGEGIVYVLESGKFISKAYLDFGGEEKLKIKWRTKENTINTSDIRNSLDAKDIPDNISEVGEDILNKVLICSKSNKPYRITKEELLFYKKHLIPLPRLHPEERYRKRFKKILHYLNS